MRKIYTYLLIGILAFQSSQLEVHAHTATIAASTTQQVVAQSTNTTKLASISSTNTAKLANISSTNTAKLASISSTNTAKLASISSNNTTSKLAASISKEMNLRTDIVDYAKQFKGIPYVWGGTSLTRGVDCSGFTQSILKKYGIYIPRTSRTQATSGKSISVKNIKPGDLVFYATNGRIDHVALYIGNGKVIHASTPKTGVRITKLNYRKPYKVVNYIKM